MLLSALPLVAHCSGIAHDLGKATEATQALLRHGARETAARHEYVSAWALAALLDVPTGGSGDLFAAPLPVWDRVTPPLGAFRFQAVADAVTWAVLTHHRLPARDATAGGPCASAFLRKPTSAAPAWAPALAAPTARTPLNALGDKLRNALASNRAAGCTRAPAPGVWALAWIARAVLILADHAVSAEPALEKHRADAWDTGVWANTSRRVRSPTQRTNTPDANTPKQTLPYHLSAVGTAAEDLAQVLVPWLHHARAPLSHATLDAALPACEARFAWQTSALSSLTRWRTDGATAGPRLLLTVAPTGSGKTRFHAQAVQALNHGEVRFTIALPLRQLTYQTALAIASEIPGLHAHQVLCITGECAHVANALVTNAKAPLPDADAEDADGNALIQPAPTAQPLARTDGAASWSALPTALATAVAAQAPASEHFLASPVVVSTVDQVLHAADPTAQGAHAVALLRVFSGDLVLDEIDACPADRMQAVLRLISLAALAGRNVLCSSATLSGPLARACACAFAQGLARRRALLGDAPAPPNACVGLVDGASDFRTFPTDPDGLAALEHTLCHHAERVACRGPIAVELTLSERTRSAWVSAVAQCIQAAHAALAWAAPGTGRTHSAGVVRVAHIRDAVYVASALMTLLPSTFQYRLCVLHGQLPAAWRAHIERRLSAVLTRKGPQPYAAYLDDPDLATCDGPLIVVATSVIESGSDYCFDWAVADAWSWHSFHQLRGRVMRHRPLDAAARVHVPTWSLKHCRQSEASSRDGAIAPYTRPGNWPRTPEGVTEAPSQVSLLGLPGNVASKEAMRFLQHDDAHAAAHFAHAPLNADIHPDEMTAAHYYETRLRERPTWRMERWAALPTDNGAWALHLYCPHRRRWDAAGQRAPVRLRCVDENAPALWPPLPRLPGAADASSCDAWAVHAPTLAARDAVTFHGRWGFSPAF